MICVSNSLSDCRRLTLAHWIIFAMPQEIVGFAEVCIDSYMYETRRQKDVAHILYTCVDLLMLTPINYAPHLSYKTSNLILIFVSILLC